MTYEYGTGQQGLNYPNPYKIENKFLFIRLALFLITSIVLFIFAKLDLKDKNYTGLALYLVMAFAFLAGAVITGYGLSHQLRVYFGRGQPNGLSPEIHPDVEGMTESAAHLKETIRQGALSVKTPDGNLNGFLYSYIKHLIIAPLEIQRLCQHSFGNIIKLGIILATFALSSFFSLGSENNGWMGLFFSLAVGYMVFIPLLENKITNVDLSLKTFWKFLFISIGVPIVIIVADKNLPNLSMFYFGTQAFIMLIIAMIGEVALLHALSKQLEEPTGITTAFEQDAITFNAPPNQLLGEIERKLFEKRVAQIPNRIYAKIIPKIAQGRTDVFKGQVIQETQPMIPKALEEDMTIAHVLQDARKKSLFAINVMATIGTIVGIAMILTIVVMNHNNGLNKSLSWIPLAGALICVSGYWTKILHSLWGRFDFESTLYIFDLEGNYSTAEVNYGNYMKDRFQTKKEIVNIENMTLRVWVTHLRTAVFGHGIDSEVRPRRIIAMTGLKDESKTWLNMIKDFAQGQSMIVAPTSKEDINRANAITQINAMSDKLMEHQKDNLNNQSITNVAGLNHIIGSENQS